MKQRTMILTECMVMFQAPVLVTEKASIFQIYISIYLYISIYIYIYTDIYIFIYTRCLGDLQIWNNLCIYFFYLSFFFNFCGVLVKLLQFMF